MATREQLEAQIAAAPLDEAGYLVYADWLQLQGDPRGELIALDVAAQHARSDRAVWRRRRGRLFSRHPELMPPMVSDVAFDWFSGFVRRVTFRRTHSGAELFAHPSLAFVSEIAILDTWKLSEDRIAELAARVPCLRRVELGDASGLSYAGNIPGSPVRIERALPLHAIEHLYSSLPVTFGAAPRLRSLELAAVDVDGLRMLEKAKLPELERLVLHIRPQNITLDDLRPLFVVPPPKLRELEIPHLAFGDALVPMLATSPLLRQLRALHLWNAGFSIAGCRQITPEAFGHLELLDLSDPGLDDESVRLLERVCADVRTISPRIREILGRPR